MKIINFRVDDAEHQLMHALASAAGMTLSGYIRQHFRTRAIAEGLVPNPLDALRVQPEAPKPAAKPTPAPTPKPVTKSPYIPMEYPNPFADLPPVDDVMFDYPEPVDNPPPDDML